MPYQHNYHLPIKKPRYGYGESLGIPRGYLPPKKRKVNRLDEEGEQLGSDPESSSQHGSSRDSRSDEDEHPHLEAPQLPYTSRDLIDEYQLAGLGPSDAIPEPPFPAAEVGYHPRQNDHLAEAKKRLRELHPPLYEQPDFREPLKGRIGAQEQHLGVMNTLVHRFLTQGDYARASRAWGLLIRAMPDGTNVRAFGRWGIGAEILMRIPESFNVEDVADSENEFEMSGAAVALDRSGRRRSRSKSISIHDSSSDENRSNTGDEPTTNVRIVRDSSDDDTSSATPEVRTVQPSNSRSRSPSNSQSNNQNDNDSRPPILKSLSSPTVATAYSTDTREILIPNTNLEAAKQYYERLIIRHAPVHRNVTPEQRAKQPNFYPALMSVWIYQITQRVQMAKKQLEQARNQEEQQILRDENRMDIDGDDDEFSTEEAVKISRKWASTMARIRQDELADAKEVAERLDTVLEGPPYDSDPQLLRLRGMVGQWIADLLRPASRTGKEASRLSLDVDEDIAEDSEMAKQLRIARAMFTRAGEFERPAIDE